VVALNDLPEMPQPPGDVRMTYEEGNEIFVVQPEDIGIDDPTALGALVLDHHGDVLPWRQLPDGGILFYAPRRVTDSDNNDSVFVRLDAGDPSPAMRTREAFTTITPPQTPGEATERGIQLSRAKRVSTHHAERLSTLPVGARFVSQRVQRASSDVYP